jgi:cyanophycinase-like exopeptidase
MVGVTALAVDLPRLIAIFGSGETSLAMTSVHQDLMARMGRPRLNAILLDTTFGFQENADEIVAKTVTYFRDHVGCDIGIASLRHKGQASALEFEQFLIRLADANYLFAGPGSPTYALRQWSDPAVRGRLVGKVVTGGCIAFSSAAAIGLGEFALPVYEIYKVGHDPLWMQGLDLLGEIGVRCAVIPHYNNTEGGTHDTRYCYMGERRLRCLEAMLPDDAIILGVDEYTACIIDVDAQSVSVHGRGGVMLRCRGAERRWERTTFALSELKDPATMPVSVTASAPIVAGPSPFLEQTETWSARGSDGIGRGDVDTVVAAILEIENVLHQWVADIAGTDERDRVRAEMRHLIVRLGDLQRKGGQDYMRESFAPIVDVVLSLRGEARRQQRFTEADRLRAILMQCGVEVHDTPAGTEWTLARK